MGTATQVPQTRSMNGEELSADHAWDTLREYGRWHLARDSFTRFRYGDGLTNSRALAFQICLSIIPGAIALVGLSAVLNQRQLGRVLELTLSRLAPGAGVEAVRDVLADSHRQAGHTGGTLALWLGLITALVSLTSAMAQVERGANRIYGVERDRPFHRKYARALLMAVTAGAFMTVGFVVMVGGGAIGRALAQVYGWGDGAMEAFALVRWPLGFLLALLSTSVLFRAAPRRRQPGHTWLAFGALVSIALWTVFTLLPGLLHREQRHLRRHLRSAHRRRGAAAVVVSELDGALPRPGLLGAAGGAPRRERGTGHAGLRVPPPRRNGSRWWEPRARRSSRPCGRYRHSCATGRLPETAGAAGRARRKRPPAA